MREGWCMGILPGQVRVYSCKAVCFLISLVEQQSVLAQSDSTVSIWNLGFDRSNFDNTTQRHRRLYQTRALGSKPSMFDDICACGLLFLSLALCVKGSRAYPWVDTPPGALGLLSSFRHMASRPVPRPEMPPFFGDVDYLSSVQRASLWYIVMDMIYDSRSMNRGMRDILDRLEFALSV